MSSTSTAPLQYSAFTASTRRRTPESAASCGCQASNTSGAQAAALAALATLAASCTNTENVINQNPLGRYANSGSCSFDCGFKEQNWSWWADYRPTNANLAQAVTSTNITGPYQTAFQPTRNWVGTDLPRYSTTLTANLTQIAQIDAAIVQAGGEITPQQQAALTNAFNASAGQVQGSLEQANGCLQQLSSFLSWEQGHTGDLQNTVNASHAFITQDATGIENDLISKIACGADDVRNTFNAMFADVNAKFTTMQAGFNTVTSNLQSAIQAGSAVAGVFLVIQSDSKLVSDQLIQAQSFPAVSPLRTMHLNIASQEWAGLVQEANSQLVAAT